MRERLIRLLNECRLDFEKTCPQYQRAIIDCASCKYDYGGECDYNARRADYLLANGVVVLPCEMNDIV